MVEAFEEGVIKPRRYRNRRLGDFLKELDLTEGRATGIPLIHQALKENDSSPAFFDTDEDRSFFEVTIPIHPAFEGLKEEYSKSGAKSGAKLTSKQQEILEIIQAHPEISYREVAQRLDITNSTAQKHFDNLKKKGIKERIGPAKGGYWKVTN